MSEKILNMRVGFKIISQELPHDDFSFFHFFQLKKLRFKIFDQFLFTSNFLGFLTFRLGNAHEIKNRIGNWNAGPEKLDHAISEKLDHGISTSILDAKRKIGSRDWSQHQLTKLCSHCRCWAGPCAPWISELEPLTYV